MQRLRTILIALVALTLTVPTFAAAEWAGRGFYEPDTLADREGGFMFADPDTSTDAQNQQVYFSGFASHFVVGVNPNVGTLETNRMPFPTSFHAMLGVWKDCNADGYIGVLEGALLSYRSEVLLDNSICEPGTSAHNDGQWVQEFLWIGPDTAARCERGDAANPVNDTDPYDLQDDCARIWADYGLPADSGQITCPVNPRPRGTYQSTGGALRFVDCITNYRVNDGVNTVFGPLDGTAGLQFSFDDAAKERPDQSASVLNQKNPYGQPSGDSMVVVYDCSAPIDVRDPTAPDEGPGDLERVVIADPTGGDLSGPQDIEIGTLTIFDEETKEFEVRVTEEDGTLHRAYMPVVPTVNPAGSPAGTVNETLEGAAGDCARDEGIGTNSDLYDLDEADFEPATPTRKNHDIYFNFQKSERPTRGGAVLGDATPDDLGQGISREALATPFWFGAPGAAASRNGFVRTDTFTPQAAQYVSFYAYVSEVQALNLAMPQPALAVYGADHCDGTSPTSGNWDCNPAGWWLDPNGESTKTVWQVAVGQVYNMRDIDCYEEATTAALSGTSCAR